MADENPKMVDVFTTPRSSKFSDQERKVLNFIKSTVLGICKPAKIDLFGSRARNNFVDESDYDIFVLFRPGTTSKDERRQLSDRISSSLSVLKDPQGNTMIDVFVEEETPPNPDPDAETEGMYSYNVATFPHVTIYP